MEILKFTTNITDRKDVAMATPYLDKLEEIQTWKVDTETQEKILSIAGMNLDPQRIEKALAAAGFTAVIYRVIGISGEDL
jgi:copper chaperone